MHFQYNNVPFIGQKLEPTSEAFPAIFFLLASVSIFWKKSRLCKTRLHLYARHPPPTQLITSTLNPGCS